MSFDDTNDLDDRFTTQQVSSLFTNAASGGLNDSRWVEANGTSQSWVYNDSFAGDTASFTMGFFFKTTSGTNSGNPLGIGITNSVNAAYTSATNMAGGTGITNITAAINNNGESLRLQIHNNGSTVNTSANRSVTIGN